MDIESVRNYCLSLPHTTEDMAFGDGLLLFRVFNRIFACLTIDGEDYMALKCDPEYALQLRDEHAEIEGAFHWNKKYWNQLPLRGTLSSDLIRHLIRHSYSQVAAKLPKAIRTAHPEILLQDNQLPD